MEVIKSFFGEYGYSFIMMVIMGAVIALTLEVSVKSVFTWLAEKFKDKETILDKLTIVKSFVIQAYIWTGVVFFTSILMNTMPLPGNKAFLPVWVGMVYVIQYVFSCYGLKGLLGLSARRLEKAEARAKAKAEAEAMKPVLTPVPGTNGLYTTPDGRYVNAKGQPV